MSDLISKKELYRKLGEAYNKGFLTWGANEVIKDIIGECDSVDRMEALINDVKAEIEKQIKRDFAFSETETLKVPCHYGTANGLQVALRILENIGKTECEDKING